MATEETWADAWAAIARAWRKLSTSEGAAQATVFQGCASGEVRSRHRHEGPDQTLADFWHPIPTDFWRDAIFDAIWGITNDRFPEIDGRRIQINLNDLDSWLEHRAVTAASQTASPSPAATATAKDGDTPKPNKYSDMLRPRRRHKTDAEKPKSSSRPRKAPRFPADAKSRIDVSTPEQPTKKCGGRLAFQVEATVTPRRQCKANVNADKVLANRLRSVVASAEKRLEANPTLSERQLAKLLTQAGKLHGFGFAAVRQIIRRENKAQKRLGIPGVDRSRSGHLRPSGHR